MNPAPARALALLLAIGAVPVAGIVLARPLASLPMPRPDAATQENRLSLAIAMVDSLSKGAELSAAFRANRTPARQAFDARRIVAPPAVPVPRPGLVLTGILWGRDPAAVMEGLPGIEGSRLVRRGDVIGGIAIRQISRTSVSATGLDTTWVLRVREVWR